MVRFKDDCETFCLYIVHRPPNIDGVVDQHVEDRHLEKAVRGISYVAHYDHRPAEGEAVRVHLDQFCGRLDPDDETGVEARATAWKSNDIDQRVRAAVAERGEREAAALALVEDPDGGERAQHAVEGGGVRAGGGGQLVARPGAIGQQVGDAEDGDDVERLGDLESIDEASQRRRRSLAALPHAAPP